jgi:hypothetical protein
LGPQQSAAKLAIQHFIGATEQRWCDCEAERLGGLEIDYQFKHGRLHDWQVGGFFAFEDASNVDSLSRTDNLFIRRRAQLVMLAARNAVPAIYPFRADAEAGGLMSYGVSLSDAHRQAGSSTTLATVVLMSASVLGADDF